MCAGRPGLFQPSDQESLRAAWAHLVLGPIEKAQEAPANERGGSEDILGPAPFVCGSLLSLLDGAQDQVCPRGAQGLLIGGLEEAGAPCAHWCP